MDENQKREYRDRVRVAQMFGKGEGGYLGETKSSRYR